jgi:hypothetical protein
MTGAPSLRLALLAAVAALFASLLAAVPAAASATAAGPHARTAGAEKVAPDPSEDHYWLPRRCVESPDEYVPGKPGPCFITKYKKNRPTVVVWGDSHAWQHLPAIVPLARQRKVNLVLFMLGGCPPILIKPDFRGTLYSCEKSNQMALQFVKRLKADHRKVRVILGGFWDGYYKVYRGVYVTGTMDPSPFTTTQLRSARTFHKLTPKLIRTLGEQGIRVDLIGQAASVPANPPNCARGNDPYECDLRRSVAMPREKKWNGWFRTMQRSLPGGSRVVKFSQTYCNRTVCHGFTDGVRTFFDPTHLSRSRTKTFRKFFAPSFRGLR